MLEATATALDVRLASRKKRPAKDYRDDRSSPERPAYLTVTTYFYRNRLLGSLIGNVSRPDQQNFRSLLLRGCSFDKEVKETVMAKARSFDPITSEGCVFRGLRAIARRGPFCLAQVEQGLT